MKFRTVTVVAASIGILVGATSCSSTCTTGSGSTPKPTKTVAAKTFTASDLPTILTTAEKQLGISGTVLDNSQVQAKLKQAKGTGGISTLLSQSGVSISPAACGQIVKDDLNAAPPAGSVDSILSYGNNAVTVTAIAGKPLPKTLATRGATSLSKILNGCSSMKLTISESGQKISIPFTIKKVALTTDADSTTALVETLTTPSSTGGAGTPVTVQAVSAVAGNLYISAEAASTAVTAASTPSAAAGPTVQAVINAVVAASKK